jgi:hypothetical protein
MERREAGKQVDLIELQPLKVRDKMEVNLDPRANLTTLRSCGPLKERQSKLVQERQVTSRTRRNGSCQPLQAMIGLLATLIEQPLLKKLFAYPLTEAQIRRPVSVEKRFPGDRMKLLECEVLIEKSR